jgi:hypothetical protein
VRLYQDTPAKLQFALSRTWWILLLLSFFLLSGWFFPAILPRQIRSAVDAMNYFLWIFAAVSVAMLAYMANRSAADRPRSQRRLFVLQGLSLCFFLALIVKIMIFISPERSAKPIAEATLPRLNAAMQVVFYDTYVAGMSFYLQSERPLWFITHGHKKRTFLGNYYAIGKRADPTTAWGKAILTFQEFQEYWKTTRQPLLIIVKEKNLSRLASEVGEAPVKLAAVDEYLLVSKP